MSLDVARAQLKQFVPPGLVVEVGSGDFPGELLPAELAATEGWAPHRRAQFALGRGVARRALKNCGAATVPIVFDGDGVPMWPAGIVASISHKRQNCIVVAGARSRFDSVGVDLELDAAERDEDEILASVCPTSEERSRARQLPFFCRSPAALFLAAKEAFFKLQFPLTRAQLAWDDVLVTFGPANSFAVHAEGFRASSHVAGVVNAAGGWLVALAVLPKAQ